VQAGKNSYKRAALFSERTIRPTRRRADVYEPEEALLVSLNDLGRVSPDYIAELCRSPFAEVLPALDGLVFETNGGAFVTAEEYLSGDVRQKLRDAEAAAQFSPAFEKNAAARAAAYRAVILSLLKSSVIHSEGSHLHLIGWSRRGIPHTTQYGVRPGLHAELRRRLGSR